VILDRRPIETTGQLADAVRAAVPYKEEVKSLSRVFQALRIAVNDELAVLERALVAALRVLKPGGRIAVIAYHSLEDRRAKQFLRYGNFDGEPVRDFYGNLLTPWEPLTRKPITASDDEIAANPRARSARLRIAAKREPDESGLGTAYTPSLDARPLHIKPRKPATPRSSPPDAGATRPPSPRQAKPRRRPPPPRRRKPSAAGAI
jgi:hypothetical protein